jgi:hypothetical protein
MNLTNRLQTLCEIYSLKVMKYPKAVFFLFAFGFFSFLSHGQELVLKGAVADAESGEALPFASIMVLNQNLGTTADMTGHFSLKLPEDLRNDTLVVSYIGYNTKTICICEVGSDRIHLVPKIIQLETFHFVPMQKKTRIINPFRVRSCFVPYTNELTRNDSFWLPFRPHEPTIEALYFPHHLVGNRNAFINEVWLNTRSWSIPAYFRLRVFEADENQKPSNDLVKENIIVEVTKKEELVKVNLEDYHLTFPENGIFIGFELMIRPENKKTIPLPDNADSVTLYSPYLQYFRVNKIDFTYWLYAGGNWKEQKQPLLQNGEIIKPAIALVVEH